MFIIWGSRWLSKTVAEGEFYCPQCIERDVPYRLQSGREWFTLYFVPLIPMGGTTRVVECGDCRGTFREEVLDIPAPTDGELAVARVVARLAARMERGMSLEEAEDELVEDGMSRAAAREFVDDTFGGDCWRCDTCREHFLDAIRRCPECRRPAH